MPGTGERPSRPWQSAFVLIIGFAVVVHSVLVCLWLMPDGRVRDTVGADRLSGYVNPYFQQSWDGLDPRLQRVDETLEVRAILIHPDSGRRVTTHWIDVVESEADRSASLNPERARLAGRRLAINLNQSVLRLTEDQQSMIGADYASTPFSALRRKLATEPRGRRSAAAYARADRMTTTFATLFAGQYWKGRLLYVQFRPGRKILGPDRSQGVDDIEWQWFDIGWRKAASLDRESVRAFENHIEGRE